MSLAITDLPIKALSKKSFMYCASDILPLIALQLAKDDDLLVHFEADLPDGHDQTADTKWNKRLGYYLKSFHAESFTVNQYTYSWKQPASYYEKMSGKHVTQNLQFIGNTQVKYNPFTRLENAAFSKVLVEAPCNMDRLSMNTPDVTSNIYQIACKPYRTQLPTLLEKMLVAAVLNANENGGEVVYTTRTLNPLHNEFTVEFAIDTLRQQYGIALQVVPLDLLELGFADTFDFEKSMKLGSLVVPTLYNNHGPRFICKLKRVLD